MNIPTDEAKSEAIVAYENYLDNLIKNNSDEIFTNKGMEHAPILMSRLFDCTESEVRMYCEGFKPALIKKGVYWDSLKKYLESGKSMKVLVEKADWINEEPFKLLMNERNKRRERNPDDETIQYRIVNNESRKVIGDKILMSHCNFSVFDDNKFRLEVSPKEYKAYGSFNDPVKSKALIETFNDAFGVSQEIMES